MPASLLEAPLIGGLEQGTGEPHLPPGSFLNIRNARQIRTGAIEKRPGGTNLTAMPGGSNIDHLFSRGEDVVGIGSPTSDPAGYYSAKSYSPAALALGNSAFQGNRLGGEAVLTSKPIDVIQDAGPQDTTGTSFFNPTNLTMRPAMTYGNGFYVYVTVVSNRVEVTIEDAATGTSVLSRATYSTLLSFSCDYAIPVIAGTTLVVVGREHGTANIKAASLNLAAISSGFSALTTLRSDAKTGDVQLDALTNGTGFTIAYLDNAQHVSVKSYTTAFVQTATDQEIVLANTHQLAMSIANGIVAVSYSGNNTDVGLLVWTSALVFVAQNTTIFGSSVYYNSAPVITDANTVFVTAGGSGTSVTNIVQCAYWKNTGGAGTVSITGFICRNAQLMSRPFVMNGLLYSWVLSHPKGFVSGSLQSTGTLIEWAGASPNYTTADTIGFRPIGTDCPRFTGAVASFAAGTGQKYPMSVVQPTATTVEIVFPYLETAVKGFFSREKADFGATARWAYDTIGGLTILSSGPCQYDGASIVEQGFIPLVGTVTTSSSTTGGTLPASTTYWYQCCYVYQDSSGNLTRGAPSIAVSQATGAGATNSNTVTIPTIQVTWKDHASSGHVGNTVQDSAIYIEVYRSTGNPAVANGGAIQTYLLTTVRNSVITDTVSITDDGSTSDATLSSGPTIYTFGGLLPNVAPPSFVAMCAHRSRIFGIAPDQKTIWYSKQYTQSEAINFCDAFTLTIDDTVRLIALASMDDKLIIFSDRRIYFLQGDGPLDNGLQSDYGLPIRIATDVGCVDRRSIVLTPEGLFFQSQIGIYLLDRGLNLTYVGQPVLDEMAKFPQITSAVLHPQQPWVYFMACTAATNGASGNGERLVYDYRVKKWYVDGFVADIPPHGGGSTPAFPWVPVSATRTPTAIYWLSLGGTLWVEDTTGTNFTDNGAWVYMQFEVAWMKADGVQGYQSTRSGILLGKWLSAHDAYIDWRSGYSTTYEGGTAFTDNAIQSQARRPTEQFLVEVNKEQQAVSMRFTDAAPVGGTIGTGQGARFFAMTFAVDPIDDIFRVDPIQQGG